MNDALLPTPNELSLLEITRRFDTEEKALAYFEAIRWANGIVCPHCANADETKMWKIEANPEKKIRAGLRQCAECKKQFRVTVGSIFEDSHLPLNTWLVAWFLVSGAKKGMSAKQLQRHLGLGSYKTAWFMAHRIRHAMASPIFTEKMTGTIQVDETYVGGKQKRNPSTGATGWGNKTAVVSLVNAETGDKRSVVLPTVTAANLGAAIAQNVAEDATVHTDENFKYRKVMGGRVHKVVNHGKKEYARKEADGSTTTTNHVESSFSLLKRGVFGAFHHVSRKHLHRYMAEFDFRWNHRKATDGERTVAGLKCAQGKRMTYKPLTKNDA